eukprot:GDKJ01039189.1.p1 GENE.GDKJ01039189.1~~GDKJ01039189.1.p1  ORF type:complete len:700 (-),score=192.94 GDKJ01039189.1:1366-3171(-)
MIIWTGDNTSHEDHLQTPHFNRRATEILAKIFNKYFPDIPIIASLGNHDAYPVNTLSHKRALNKWLFDGLASYWTPLLRLSSAEEEARVMETMKKGGYYSFIPRPGLRVLSLNALLFSDRNMLVDDWSKDPSGHHSWLENEFALARANNEKVWITAHFAKDIGDARKSFNIWYQTVIDRYGDLIAGSFSGHTHHDDNTVFRHSAADFVAVNSKGKPAIISFISPSLEPASNHHPISRLYKVDDEHFEVTNFSNIAGNMDYINENVDAPYMPLFKLYNFRDYTSRAMTEVIVCKTDEKGQKKCAPGPMKFEEMFQKLISRPETSQDIPSYQIEKAKKGIITPIEFELFYQTMMRAENAELLNNYIRASEAHHEIFPGPVPNLLQKNEESAGKTFSLRKIFASFKNGNENTNKQPLKLIESEPDVTAPVCDVACKRSLLMKRLNFEQLTLHAATASLRPEDKLSQDYRLFLEGHDDEVVDVAKSAASSSSYSHHRLEKSEQVEHAKKLSSIIYGVEAESSSEILGMSAEDADELLKEWETVKAAKSAEMVKGVEAQVQEYLEEMISNPFTIHLEESTILDETISTATSDEENEAEQILKLRRI